MVTLETVTEWLSPVRGQPALAKKIPEVHCKTDHGAKEVLYAKKPSAIFFTKSTDNYMIGAGRLFCRLSQGFCQGRLPSCGEQTNRNVFHGLSLTWRYGQFIVMHSVLQYVFLLPHYAPGQGLRTVGLKFVIKYDILLSV